MLLRPSRRLFFAAFLLATLHQHAATITDADHDGMSDVWQQIYSIPYNDTLSDLDHDGFPNILEAIAGTNPRDNQSHPTASPASTNALANNGNITAFTFGWQTAIGKQYELSSSPDFTAWTVHTNTVVGNGGIMNYTFTHATAQEKRFYRARARATELDTDKDGLTNWEESILGTNPNDGDTDGDGMPDKWEWQNGLSATASAGFGDKDGDGVPDLGEYLYGFKANDTDSDDDGISDFAEFPWTLDPDKDGLSNEIELLISLTHPKMFDTERDTMGDGWEHTYGLNPNLGVGYDGPSDDNDNDGMSNGEESKFGTNPNLADTDGDGSTDTEERDNGSDPNDPEDSGPSPYGVVTVRFTMGDGSSSHSEMYRFNLETMDAPKVRKYERTNSTYGVVENFDIKLKRGFKYKLTMSWIETDPEAVFKDPLKVWPDYDYTLTVTENEKVFVVDPAKTDPLKNHPMLGGHSSKDPEHEDSFWPSGLESYIYLPVIDIDVVHPATGELAESSEDSGDGGYVSVRRTVQGQDVTPVTQLVFHAVGGAKNGWKSRIKFNSGDRYKIYSDVGRTQEVVSEITEFDSTQETTLYFQGLVKSSARGGEIISAQVNIGDKWREGDTLKLTVVQSEFLFQIKAFIPYAWTEGEDVWYVPDQQNPMDGKVAHGDTRSFVNAYSNDISNTVAGGYFQAAPFRVCQTVVITPFSELHGSADIQSERKLMTALSSDHYVKATSVDPSEMSLHYGNIGLTGNATSTGKPPSNSEDYDNESRSGRVAEITVEGGGKDGALGFIGSSSVPYTTVIDDIHWRLYFKVNSDSNPLHPTVEFGGRHDRYPAYEIIVIQSNGTFKDIHRVLPNTGDLPGPDSLTDSHGRDVGRSDTVE